MTKNDGNKFMPTPIVQWSTFTGVSWEDPAGPPYRGVWLLARDTSAQLILCGQAGRRWAEFSNQSLYWFSYLTTNTRHLESWHSRDLLCPWVVLAPERSAPSGSRTSSKLGSIDEFIKRSGQTLDISLRLLGLVFKQSPETTSRNPKTYSQCPPQAPPDHCLLGVIVLYS